MQTKISQSFTVIFVLIIMLGCSARDSGSPVSPSQSNLASEAILPASQQLWGMWQISIDPISKDCEIVPLRSSQFQANVTQFLQPPSSPTNLLSLSLDLGQSNFDEGYVVCTVTLKHPFPGLPQYRGFDVRGICMGDGSISGISADGELWAGLDDLRVLNADGYTRWWNPAEFLTYNKIFGYTQGKLAPPKYKATATVNGYKYFADGLGAEDPLSALDLNNRGTYAVKPGVNSRLYIIQFPVIGGVPSILFNYAVTASYLDPDPSGMPDYPLESFPTSANLAEAFRIAIEDKGSTAYYENSSSYGGNLKFDLEVFDWGFGLTSNVTDEIKAITLESPTLFDEQIEIDLGTAIQGSTKYSWIFPVLISNVTPTGTQNQEIMVRVLSAHPDNYAPDIPGISGFIYPDAPLAAYYLWTAPISSSPQNANAPQVGVIDGPSSLFENEQGLYTLSYATDVEDGTNLTILWENDGDNDFNDDLDGNNKDLKATLKWSTKGNYKVIARAIDTGGLFTDSAPYDVTVNYCPTAVHKNFASFTLGGVPSSNLWRMDSAFQTVGPYAGQLITLGSQTELRRFDTYSGSTWTSQPYINIYNANSTTISASIDVCDFSGRVIYAGRSSSWTSDTFQVYDVNGNYLATLSVGPGRWVSAIDTDKNGDLWVASCASSWPGNKTWLQHFEYKSGPPYYTVDPADELETTAQIPKSCNTWDLAVAYGLRRIYLFHGNYNNGPAPYGEIYTYDIASDGKLTYNDSIKNLNVFPEVVAGAYMDNAGFCTYGKIEIDHATEASEGCRIIAMARSMSNWDKRYFVLLDANLNIVDTYSATLDLNVYSFSIRGGSDPTKRQIVCTSYTSGSVWKSEPPPGW